jgi:DNA ligase-3
VNYLLQHSAPGKISIRFSIKAKNKMSDSSRKFLVDYSKRVSKCQNSSCKAQMDVGSLRLGKVGPSPFGDGEMKQYYHPKCMFDTFKRARASTKVIESADDIADFSAIKDDDKKAIVKLIKGIFSNQHIIFN